MGNPLATGTESEERGHGRGGGVVRADRRPEHRASPVAIREPGGEESEEGDELGGRRVGRHGAQDGPADPEDEVADTDSDALESGCVRRSGRGGLRSNIIPSLHAFIHSFY